MYALPPGHLPHEGVFAGRPGGTDEDDGWLLVPCQDGINNIAGLLVFDARTWPPARSSPDGSGTICR